MKVLIFGGGSVGLGIASCLIKSKADVHITEIDALNGAVIKLAENYQVNVPYNLTVYNMVKFLEAQSY